MGKIGTTRTIEKLPLPTAKLDSIPDLGLHCES